MDGSRELKKGEGRAPGGEVGAAHERPEKTASGEGTGVPKQDEKEGTMGEGAGRPSARRDARPPRLLRRHEESGVRRARQVAKRRSRWRGPRAQSVEPGDGRMASGKKRRRGEGGRRIKDKRKNAFLSPTAAGKVAGMMNSGPYQPFPKTHWSLVQRAGAADAAARQEALATLLARYAPALRSYLRMVRRMPAEKADDLLQAFITDRLLASELLRSADAGRGQFRTLLLTSLNRFATSRFRAEKLRSAQDLEDVEIAGGPGQSPSAAVEAEWARALVHQVIEAMRRECEESGREDVWAVFEGRVLAEVFEHQRPIAYETLAAKFGLKSPTQAANLLVTAKRTYARLLRTAVAEYEPDEGRIEAEIEELKRILAAGYGAEGTDPGEGQERKAGS